MRPISIFVGDCFIKKLTFNFLEKAINNKNENRNNQWTRDTN